MKETDFHRSILTRVRSVAIAIFYSCIWAGVIYLGAWFLYFALGFKNFQDVLTVVGLLFIIIGAFTFLTGNPSGVGISSVGDQHSGVDAIFTAEVIRSERESTNYYKNFKNQNVFSVENGKKFIVLGGIIAFMISIIAF